MKSMKVRNYTMPFHFLVLVLLGPGGCGIEVGNPTKPQPAPSADDQSLLAMVATEQLEETVAVAADGHGSDDANLRLLATRSCELSADASVLYKVERDDSSSRDVPRLNPTTRISVSSSRSSSATLRASESGLGCRVGGRIPSVDWQSLSLVQSEITSSRKTAKTLSALPDATLKESLEISAEGNRQVTWRREAIDGNNVSLSRSISFHSAVTRTSSLNSIAYTTTVESIEPLVLKQNNIGLKMNSLSIESGSILSDYKEGQKLLLAYSNLEFIKGSSCYPESGTITAGIYNSSDLKTPVLSFNLVFHDGELSMVFTDGTSKELELSDCTLGSN